MPIALYIVAIGLRFSPPPESSCQCSIIRERFFVFITLSAQQKFSIGFHPLSKRVKKLAPSAKRATEGFSLKLNRTITHSDLGYQYIVAGDGQSLSEASYCAAIGHVTRAIILLKLSMADRRGLYGVVFGDI